MSKYIHYPCLTKKEHPDVDADEIIDSQSLSKSVIVSLVSVSPAVWTIISIVALDVDGVGVATSSFVRKLFSRVGVEGFLCNECNAKCQ